MLWRVYVSLNNKPCCNLIRGAPPFLISSLSTKHQCLFKSLSLFFKEDDMMAQEEFVYSDLHAKPLRSWCDFPREPLVSEWFSLNFLFMCKPSLKHSCYFSDPTAGFTGQALSVQEEVSGSGYFWTKAGSVIRFSRIVRPWDQTPSVLDIEKSWLPKWNTQTSAGFNFFYVLGGFCIDEAKSTRHEGPEPVLNS